MAFVYNLLGETPWCAIVCLSLGSLTYAR